MASALRYNINNLLVAQKKASSVTNECALGENGIENENLAGANYIKTRLTLRGKWVQLTRFKQGCFQQKKTNSTLR
jgi:hypothetical protein